MNPLNRSGYCLVLLTILITQPISAADADSPQSTDTATIRLSANMRNGNIVQIETTESLIEWKTVSPDGKVTESRIQLSNIARLDLTTSPASSEVSAIRSLVAELASDDYRLRHRAETQLMEEGKPFEQVISQARQHEEPEVRYRVDRILKSLAKKKADNKTRFALDFDEVHLKDGERLEGDIGEFAVTGTWMGRPITLTRSNTSQLATQPLQLSNMPEALPFATTIIQDPLSFYESKTDGEKKSLGPVQPNYVQVTFDSGKQGEAMVSDRDFPIDEQFTFLGTRLACETNDGSVVISGYGFKKSQSRGRSAGNFFIEPTKNKKTSYQGTMRIDFCLPGQGSLPATVNSVGMFTEIVVPRHTIVQAYNSSGHVIGLTESSQDKMSFIGLSSNEPIAYLRVSENRYLDVEKLNRDFAIDDLTYSRPIAAPDLNISANNQAPTAITTHDEQRLLVSKVRFDESSKRLRATSNDSSLGEFELNLDKVAWITPGQAAEADKPLGGFFVMLRDGSVVHCRASRPLQPSSQPEWQIDPSSIIGVWSAARECRYPVGATFENGSCIAVLPLETIAFQNLKFDWNEVKFDYQLSEAKRVEAANPDEETPGVTAKDIGLEASAETNGSLSLTDIPFSIWLEEPTTRRPKTGLLRTKDGQSFVLGGDTGFQLKAMNGQQITILFQGREMSFELEQVAALNLPR